MDQNNKQVAVQFMELVTAGKIPKAYEKFVDMSGKHHNAFFAAGFSVLQKAMEANHAQFPGKIFKVKNIIGDGDLVAVHSQIILGASKQISAVHIFRFQNGKIVEMWDVSQILPDDLPNTDGAF